MEENNMPNHTINDVDIHVNTGEDKELFAQLQAKQLESQKLVKSFNTTNSNLKEGLFGSDTEFVDNAFEKLKDLTE